MSTQQQIDAYQSAIDQKQQELAGQEFTLRVQQEELVKAEQASSAARRAQGPSLRSHCCTTTSSKRC